MLNEIVLWGLKIPLGMAVVLTYALWVSVLLVVKRVLFHILRNAAKYTKTNLDDLFIETANWPTNFLVYASGGLVLSKVIPVGDMESFSQDAMSFFKAITIVAVVLFLNKFLLAIVQEYSPKVPILRDTAGIIRVSVRLIVFGMGGLILLDSFGVSITPLIASLGVGSLAIALALQPTLENLFSGIQLVIDKPIQVGHFIKLESGEEGYVDKIGWRSTWIRMLPNNTVIMPNKNLVNAKIVNYYYPEKELAVLVQVGVHYNSDLEQVERVTIEVAKETLKEVPGGIGTFEPFIRYHTFGDFSINFSVILRAREFVDNYLIIHEFIKRLHKRYAKEGIVIPYPIRAINTDQEKAASNMNKDR